MSIPRQPGSTPTLSPREEALYDRYLDHCVDGGSDTPGTFLAEAGPVTEALRHRMRTLHDLRREATPPTKHSLPFRELGGYRLVARIGEGGMGSVYLAEQVALNRRVALKVIRSDLATSERIQRRFEREARAVARLRHPHIVGVHDFGRDRGVAWIAMEHVQGQSLDALLRAGRPSVPEVLRWGESLARALHAAHAQGVIHRDVKPQNIRITPEGRAVLLDFGIARWVDEAGARLTTQFAGSPMYAAPEQLRGAAEALDGRADIHGLGATLYECLAGRPPIPAGPMDRMVAQVLQGDRIPLGRAAPAVPRDVGVVIDKALATRPVDRYASAEGFADDLGRAATQRPIRARPPGVPTRIRMWARRHPAWAGMAAVAVVVALAGWMLMQASAHRAQDRARSLVEEARQWVDRHRAARLAHRGRERRLLRAEQERGAMFWSAEKDAAFEDLLDEVTSWRRQREEVVFEVLDRLNQALRLDPDVPGAAEVRALLLHERAEAAHAAQDTTLERYFRAQVTAMDPGGEFTAPHRARASLTFTSTPPGATVFIHRMEEQRTFLGAGDRRHVPVPFGPAGRVTHPLVETGAWALRVVAPAQGLAEGDLITQVDGVPVRSLPSDAWRRIGREGAAAVTTWTAGVLRTQAVAPGLRLRPTAAPRVRVPAAAWGVTPRAAVELPVGVYVAVLVLAGHEDTRLLVHVQDGVHRTYDVALRPSGTTPEGFVCVESDGPVRRSRFWIQERPVSRADYLSFLGSGTAGERWTQAQTQGEAAPFTWREGRLVWRAGVDPAVPITNLSWQAAQAYARWRGARDGRAYRLPTLEDWWRAAGTPGWRWPFGNQFRHKWVRTTLTDPGPPRFVHPFDQPIDASSRDVYSVTGNVSEWLDQDWGDPRADRKQYTGGSAVNADPKVFRTGGGNGQRTDVPLAWVGCRLVFDG